MVGRFDASRTCCGDTGTLTANTGLRGYHTSRFNPSGPRRLSVIPGLYSGNLDPDAASAGVNGGSSGMFNGDEYLSVFIDPFDTGSPGPYDITVPQNAVDAVQVLLKFAVGLESITKVHDLFMPLPNQTIDLIPLDIATAPIDDLADFPPLVQPETTSATITGVTLPNDFAVNVIDITAMVNAWGQRRINLGITAARPLEFQILARPDRSSFSVDGDIHNLNTGDGAIGLFPRDPGLEIWT